MSWQGRELKSWYDGSNATINYGYNADGIRNYKEVYDASTGKTTRHEYLLSGSQIVKETVYVDGTESYTLVYLYDETGSPIGYRYRTPSYASGVFDGYFYEKNLQGDIIKVFNQSGTQLANYIYDAWGNPTITYLGNGASTPAKYNPFAYRGYYLDIETGWYYLQSRYYNPVWGRFINADGQLNDGLFGYNLFAYCLNNPILFDDDNGNLPKWMKGALAVVGGVLATAIVMTALPAAACFAGTLATFYFGSSTIAAIATTATYAFGTVTAVASGAYMADSIYYQQTGDTVLLDAMGGNEALYQAGAAITSIATAGVMGMAAEGYAHGVCFVAGTLVSTNNGNIPIEEISVGDLVYAHNTDTGETLLKEVVNTFVNETNELVHISVNGEKITTTPMHPFYVPQKGWTSAIQLRAGDRLQLLNGEYVVIEMVQHELLESPITVYNFEVADFHTYCVGENAVLVHNNCDTFSGTNKETKHIAKSLGYSKVNGAQSHGEAVYYNPKAPFNMRYISYDNTSHNGGYWKAASSISNLANKQTRTGTFTWDLKINIGE